MTSPFTIREEDAGFRVYCFSAGMYPIGSREDAERLKRSLDYEWARHNPTDDDIRSFLEVFDQRDEALADLAKERERAEKAEAERNEAQRIEVAARNMRDEYRSTYEAEYAAHRATAAKLAAMREALSIVPERVFRRCGVGVDVLAAITQEINAALDAEPGKEER